MIDDIDIENLTSENYKIKKSILRESIIRVDYTDVIALEKDNLISNIEKELKKYNLRIVNKSTIGEIKIDLKNILSLDPSASRNNTPIDFVNNRIVYEFYNEKENLSVQISPLFTYIRQKGSFIKDTPGYLGYENLSKVIVNVLKVINNNIPLNYTRIGIRKFNSLFSTKKSVIKKAFNKLLVNDIAFYPSKINNFYNPRIEKLYNFYKNNFGVNLHNYIQIVQLENQNGKKVNSYNFNFDIDVYTSPELLNNNIEQNMLKGTLEQANKILYAIFLWSLSGESINNLQNDKNITEIVL